MNRSGFSTLSISEGRGSNWRPIRTTPAPIIAVTNPAAALPALSMILGKPMSFLNFQSTKARRIANERAKSTIIAMPSPWPVPRSIRPPSGSKKFSATTAANIASSMLIILLYIP